MFQFPAFPLYTLSIHVYIPILLFIGGFPHSDICGSIAICAYPQLFAACRVLLRLLVARHSPCALCNLTFLLLILWFSCLKSFFMSLFFPKISFGLSFKPPVFSSSLEELLPSNFFPYSKLSSVSGFLFVFDIFSLFRFLHYSVFNVHKRPSVVLKNAPHSSLLLFLLFVFSLL